MRQCQVCGKPLASHGADATAVFYDTMINTLCDECLEKQQKAADEKKRQAWESSLDGRLAAKFVCGKCQNKGAEIKRIAVATPGLGAALDIERNVFVAASCRRCGYTEFYNPQILGEKPIGLLETLFDLWAG